MMSNFGGEMMILPENHTFVEKCLPDLIGYVSA